MRVYTLVSRGYEPLVREVGLFSLKYLAKSGIIDLDADISDLLDKNEGFALRYRSVHFTPNEIRPMSSHVVAVHSVNPTVVYVYNRNYALDILCPPRSEYLMSGMTLAEFNRRSRNARNPLDPMTAEPMTTISARDLKGKHSGLVVYAPEILVGREVIPPSEFELKEFVPPVVTEDALTSAFGKAIV